MLMTRADDSIVIPITRMHENAVIPQYAHLSDAGADLVSVESVTLRPGERRLVPTGIAIALPEGYVGLVHPRSGLAIRNGVALVNAPGTIDAGYRGEIKVCLINLDPQVNVELPAGTRIAQLVVQEVARANFVEVSELSETERGDGGFGSTGLQV